jgi:acyl carrier protein
MRDLLDREDVAGDDNFFEIGGDSFLALSLIKKIKDQFGVKLSILDLVRSATPHAISVLLNR